MKRWEIVFFVFVFGATKNLLYKNLGLLHKEEFRLTRWIPKASIFKDYD